MLTIYQYIEELRSDKFYSLGMIKKKGRHLTNPYFRRVENKKEQQQHTLYYNPVQPYNARGEKYSIEAISKNRIEAKTYDDCTVLLKKYKEKIKRIDADIKDGNKSFELIDLKKDLKYEIERISWKRGKLKKKKGKK